MAVTSHAQENKPSKALTIKTKKMVTKPCLIAEKKDSLLKEIKLLDSMVQHSIKTHQTIEEILDATAIASGAAAVFVLAFNPEPATKISVSAILGGMATVAKQVNEHYVNKKIKKLTLSATRVNDYTGRLYTLLSNPAVNSCRQLEDSLFLYKQRYFDTYLLDKNAQLRPTNLKK